MTVPAKKFDTFPPPGSPYDTATRGGRFTLGRALRLLGLSLAGLVLTGFPVWAARRILYPLSLRSLPEMLGDELDIEEGALPVKVEFDSLDGHQLGGWFVPGPDPGAARYLRTRPDVDPERIGALGVSMGAATAIMAAAEDPTIKAVVSDSGYADVTSMVKPGLMAFIGLPSYLFAPLIVRYAEMMIG